MESDELKPPRHMGRVVDPDVVDGADEPVVELGVSKPSESEERPASSDGPIDTAGDDSSDEGGAASAGPAPDEEGASTSASDDRPKAVGTLPPPPAPPPDRSDLLDAPETLVVAPPITPPPPPEGRTSQKPNTVPPPPAVPSAPPGSGPSPTERNETRQSTPSSSQDSADNAARPASPERDSRPSSGSLARTGHPVRDRLLAKAAQAKAEASAAPGPSDEALPAFSSLQVVSRELDEIAAPRSSDGSPLRIGGAPLSSTNLLLFGTVTGLALVASLFTLLIKLAPQQPAHEGPATATTIVPATTVAATASGQPPAPIPSVAPPPPRKKLEGPWRIGEPKTGQKKISGKIGQEPFLKAVQTAGLDKTQAYRVYTALKDERNLDRCAPRHEFVALLEKASGRVVAFEYIVSREEVYQAKEGDDGLLKGQQLDLKVQRNRVQGSLLLAGESFEAAARAAHFDPSLRLVLNKALEGHTSVAQFRRGDRLRVVAQEVTVLGEFSRYAGLEAIEYLPASGDPLRIYYFNKRKRYYDAKGRAPGEGGWRKPIKGAPITSKFNPKRMHPILKKRMPHNGTDFGAPAGTPVYASSYGTITKRGNYGANGNFIAIAHEKGYETGYSHLSRFEDGIKVGDQVKRMQVIGYVGSTGRSTGPHLHFSAKKNGAFIDPESLKLDALTVLPPEDRADFTKVRRQYDELLEAVVLPPKLPDAEPAGPEQPPTMADTVAETMGEEMMGEPSASGATAGAAQAPTAPQVAPGAPSAQSSAAAAPAPVAAAPVNNFRSLYLSDKELMESQAASDEDEVEE